MNLHLNEEYITMQYIKKLTYCRNAVVVHDSQGLRFLFDFQIDSDALLSDGSEEFPHGRADVHNAAGEL